VFPLFSSLAGIPESDVPVPPAALVHAVIAPVFKWWAARRLSSFGVTPDLYTITSADRTVAHNAEVGGVSDSAHIYGVGWDVTGSPGTLQMIEQNWPGFVLKESDHLHVNMNRAFAWAILRWVLFAVALVLSVVLSLGNMKV